jgi:signal-transduction protein with cAMP-binding, CBS, and nucleotidyltransferase domain
MRMQAAHASSLVVVDGAGRLRGVLTEGDIVARALWRLEPDKPVDKVMTSPVTAVGADDYLFQAVATLRRQKLHKAPVLGADGQIVGTLALDDALAMLAGQTLSLMEQLTHEESFEGLKRVKQAQVQLARALIDSGVPVTEVQSLLTEINIDIHRRVLRQLEAGLNEDGWGVPPSSYALIIMGSGGRGENFLDPDQDNGFIIADGEPGSSSAGAAYFQELARRMTLRLAEVGFPLCKGGVMASNVLWRKPVTAWCRQVDAWLRKREPEMLLNCDIFFDFRHAYGDAGLSDKVREHVTKALSRHPQFLRHLFMIEADHSVALGWFGQLRKEREEADREGVINLKLRGKLPLVEGARILALKAGITATSTLGRLDALKERGAIHPTDHANLTKAFHVLTHLLLRQQLEDFAAGIEVGDLVPEARLTQDERAELIASFRAIEALREVLKMEFGEGQR